jgi:hypothetical protein
MQRRKSRSYNDWMLEEEEEEEDGVWWYKFQCLEH